MAGEFISSVKSDLTVADLSAVEHAAFNKLLSAKDNVQISGIANLQSFLSKVAENDGLLSALAFSESSYARGVVLAPFGWDLLPSMYQQKIGVKEGLNLSAKPVVGDTVAWSLCTSSEIRMREAMEDSAVMVYGGLMIKFRGRLTGLCFQSFATEEGTFVRGNFYSPEKPIQEQLKAQFEDGIVEPALTPGQWYLMRGVDKFKTDGQEVLKEATIKSRHMPEVIPNWMHGFGGRHEYLINRKEEY